MKNTIKLDNPVQINGKSYDELTYDISEITAQAFAEADARKLSASGSKNGNAAGAAELDYGLHLYLGFAAIIAIKDRKSTRLNSSHSSQSRMPSSA